jgi:hypothetical protein
LVDWNSDGTGLKDDERFVCIFSVLFRSFVGFEAEKDIRHCDRSMEGFGKVISAPKAEFFFVEKPMCKAGTFVEVGVLEVEKIADELDFGTPIPAETVVRRSRELLIVDP